jgi:hypothetical protein
MSDTNSDLRRRETQLRGPKRSALLIAWPSDSSVISERLELIDREEK